MEMSSGAKLVGDGISVGTGISVGEVGACPELKPAEPTMAEPKAAESGMTHSSKSANALDPGKSAGPSPATDVGDGTSVGTGNSVGDVAARADSIIFRLVCPNENPTAGTSRASVGEGAGEVGEGASVGTGISVGEEGASRLLDEGRRLL